MICQVAKLVQFVSLDITTMPIVLQNADEFMNCAVQFANHPP